MKNITCLITTTLGIVPTLNRELKYLGVKPYDQFDTGVYVDCTIEEIAMLNLRVRTGSKIWRQVNQTKQCSSFDELFETVVGLPWEQFIPEGAAISVECNTYNSALSSAKTAQSVAHKAIINRLVGEDSERAIHNNAPTMSIRVQIAHDSLKVFINTSGNALHERGWRARSVEAPLKEHIAAALVLMTSRGYSLPLVDPCCGSGTIPIEAALIASNRAPGIGRSFACEQFPSFNFLELLGEARIQARKKIYDKEYIINGYDIDHVAIDNARYNAENAGVDHCIRFEEKDINDVGFQKDDTLITNPPYGKRIGADTVDRIHDILFHKARYCKAATIISGYENTEGLYHPRYRKVKQTRNGADECSIYMHSNS